MIIVVNNADFSASNIGKIELDNFGKKLYSYGVLSDIHLGYESRGGTADFQRAIPALENLGVEFVCITGDIGYYSDSSSQVSELQNYQNILNNYATVPYYAVTGNHDIAHSDEVWEQYTGHPKNFEIIKDGDVFLFMSLAQDEKASSVDQPYQENLTWLKERLARYQGARIFVFMHYPISGYSGLRDGQYYGFTSASTEDDELLVALREAKNAVVFSGHTHFKFECDTDYENINIYTFTDKKVSLVHVPSCAYPRNSSGAEEADLSQGYLVDVYERSVIIRGVNLAVTVDSENPLEHSAEYMPAYEFTLPIINNTSAADNGSIVLSTNEIQLESGQSADIQINLSKATNTTVSIVESNDYITVSPTTLTFTEENFDTPQTVTITAGTLSKSEFATINVSAEGMTTRMISVSLVGSEIEPDEPDTTVVAISGPMTPVNGTVYGGVCGNYSSINQLKSSAAETYNFTFSNLTLTSSQTGLYMSSSDSKTTINLNGINTIDTSGCAATSQRAISSSSTRGNYLIGVGEGAELILKGRTDATTELIKGNWVIENAKVDADGTTVSGQVLVEIVTPASGGEPAGITLRRNGEFSLNGSAVKLEASDNGYLEVNLADAMAETSTLTVTATEGNDGYVLSALLINGVEQAIDTALIMPAIGETMTIQGVFTEASNAIILSDTDISLNADESKTIDVYLTNPANVTVNVIKDSEYITVTPATLAFTEENYNIPQAITITAGTLEASESTTITVSSDGLTSRTISVSLTYEAPVEEVTAISGSMTPVNGTIYGGVCGTDYSLKNQLTASGGGEYEFTFRNLDLKSAGTVVYMPAGSSTTTINLEGVNTLDTSGTTATGQRAMSSSGTSGNYLTGIGEDVELILKNSTNSSAAALKGYWIIENAKVMVIGSVDNTSGGISVVGEGITLRKSGEFSLNGACVQLVKSDGGNLDVNLGSAAPGSATITITATEGTLSHILVNGVQQSIDTTLTMPVEGETLTIQGIFTAI